MRIRNFTKMGEGLQCCRSSPGEDLQWKGEDLQCCKPSGRKVCKGEGLQYNTGKVVEEFSATYRNLQLPVVHVSD